MARRPRASMHDGGYYVSADLSLEIRRAVVAHLRGSTALTALVPAVRIYGEFNTDQATGAWPFIRMGYAQSEAFEATCWDGTESDFTVHCFAHGPYTDDVLTIAKRVVAAMEDFAPGNVDGAWAQYQRTVCLPEENAQDWHVVVTFQIVAVEIA